MTQTTRRHSLAVSIICCNEADRIEKCLQSVHGWADQIIVFDSGSTDGTVEIAKKYATELFVTDWPGYGKQRSRALERVTCEWVLSLDADEQVTPELRAEIDAELSKETVPCSVYKMPWIPYFLGKKIKYGRYSAPQARLFLKEGAQYPTAQVHETLMFPPGDIGILKGGLLHESFRNYHHCVQKHNDYAWLLAKEKQARHERKGGLLFATVRAFWEFIHQYIFRGLFLDGAHGYLQALVLCQYSFNKYASLWSLRATNTPIDEKFLPSHRQRRQDEQSLCDDSKVTRIV